MSLIGGANGFFLIQPRSRGCLDHFSWRNILPLPAMSINFEYFLNAIRRNLRICNTALCGFQNCCVQYSFCNWIISHLRITNINYYVILVEPFITFRHHLNYLVNNDWCFSVTCVTVNEDSLGVRLRQF